MHELIALGVEFDREATGLLALAREGGHSRPRVVHAGGAATGAEVERALVDATYRSASAVLEGWFALDLLVEGGRCVGVLALPPGGGDGPVEVRADHVVLATGGAGQLFSVTTNPPESTGDGVAMALRAGVPTADVEFVQFHPTALHHPAMPRPLLSEALRGHGALLRDRDGERFVDELAPRDVVSRAMAARMAEQGVDHLWLDATGLERFSARFPTIAASLASIGLDPRARLAADRAGGPPPVRWRGHRPVGRHRAARACGPWARSPAPACTGPTGWPPTRCSRAWSSAPAWPSASRRAPRARSRAARCGPCSATSRSTASGAPCWTCRRAAARRRRTRTGWPGVDVTKLRDTVQRAMTRGAGVVRSAESLAGARAVVEDAAPRSGTRAAVGRRGRAGATCCGWPTRCWPRRSARTESRGAHARSEYPETDPAWRRRLVHGARSARDRRATVVVSRRPSTARRYAGRCADAVDRALAEDLGPDGDLTAALVPEDVQAHFALRARRAGVLAGRDCATETFRRVGPEVRPGLAGGRRRRARRRRHGAGGDRPAAADPHRRAHGAELPRAPVGRRHADGAVRRGRAREQPVGGRARHPQDHAGPARRWRRRPCGPAAAPATAPACPTPSWSRTTTWPGRASPTRCSRARDAVAGSDGRDRVRRPRPGGRGGPGRARTPCCSTTWTRAPSSRRSRWRTWTRPGPILTEVSGGVTLATIGAYAAAGPDRISVGALTHSAPVLDLGLDLIWTKAGTDDMHAGGS